MAVPERMPLANPTARTIAKFATRGLHQDAHIYESRDMVKWETDFVGNAIGDWPSLVITGGQGTAAALTATGLGGSADLVTSGNDNYASVIYLGGGNFVGNNDPVITCRIKASSLATGNVQFGFCDNIAAGVLTTNGVGPFVSPLADPPTLVSTTADAIALTYDLSSGLTTPARWRLAYSRATVAAVTGVIGPAAVAATYQTLTIALQRIDLATDQMAVKAYINGIQVASVATAVISNTAPLYPFLLIGATSGTSRTLTCDYFGVYQLRDPLTLS